MGKPKKGGSSKSGGPHKSHGPKKHMFHGYSKCIRIEMAKCGMLKKDVDSEARAQSEDAKAGKNNKKRVAA